MIVLSSGRPDETTLASSPCWPKVEDASDVLAWESSEEVLRDFVASPGLPPVAPSKLSQLRPLSELVCEEGALVSESPKVVRLVRERGVSVEAQAPTLWCGGGVASPRQCDDRMARSSASALAVDGDKSIAAVSAKLKSTSATALRGASFDCRLAKLGFDAPH